ncbi:hypothetical protein FS749_004205 [Ceratobasidium sp. UAMH 11750]|nr:hypothetical protein FS749_004205 [Ceratobasidium sp. UAMH 11750]
MLGVCEFVAIIAALAFTSRSDGSARTIDSTYISSVKRYDGVTGMCIGPIAHAVLFFLTHVPVLNRLDLRAGAKRNRICFRSLRHLVPSARHILEAILKTPAHEGLTKSESVARMALLYCECSYIEVVIESVTGFCARR